MKQQFSSNSAVLISSLLFAVSTYNEKKYLLLKIPKYICLIEQGIKNKNTHKKIKKIKKLIKLKSKLKDK